MFKDKILMLALAVSLLAHGALVFKTPFSNFIAISPRERKMEITYIKPKPEAVKPVAKFNPAPSALLRENFLKLDAKASLNKSIPPPFIGRDQMPNPKSHDFKPADFAKPAVSSPDVIAIKKKITLPPINLGKINNPSYISYYQIVREKIRRCAYRNYTYNETGEVYLSFIISSEGALKDVRLVEEKSARNPYLQDIALRSVKEAAPFSDFPKDLDYLQLSFNIIISFEIE